MEKDYIVCCICKNESAYIEEFIEYHLNLGFDKIIIGDNNDLDGERYDEQLKDYVDNGEVEIIDLRGEVAQQMPFYNSIIDRGDYEWCAFIDCDEFITLGNKTKFKNIKDFLKSNDKANAYKINWQCYGDNGLIKYENKPVIERFKTPKDVKFKFHYDFPEASHVKTMLRGGCGGKFVRNVHVVDGVSYLDSKGTSCNNSPFNVNIDYSVIYIRHYYTKSLEEWLNKKMKNKYADCLPSKNIKYYPITDYFIYNKKTESKLRFLEDNGIDIDNKKNNILLNGKSKIAVHIHIYYKNIWYDDIIKRITTVKDLFDFYITVCKDVYDSKLEKSIKDTIKNHTILLTENVGEDVNGFIHAVNYMLDNKKEYDYLLKIHTKKNNDERKLIYDSILDFKNEKILNAVENSHLMVCNGKFLLSTDKNYEECWDCQYVDEICNKINCKSRIVKFPALTMFWIRYDLIKKYFSNHNIGNDYFNEPFSRFGTRAHSMERVFGMIVTDNADDFVCV